MHKRKIYLCYAHMKKVLFFNPRSANSKPRIPNSILQVAASVEGTIEWAIVDGNLEEDSWLKISSYLKTNEYRYFASTVMPGPQLHQAIRTSRKIRHEFPSVKIIWGGYFPSNHYKAVLSSGYVDFIINGQGDKAFAKLLSALESGSQSFEEINNLIYKSQNGSDENLNFSINPSDEIYEQDELNELPYHTLNKFYPLKKYLGKTYLGEKTIAYHSSMGCPFTCSFCAVVPLYKGRWKGKSAIKIYSDIKYLKEEYGGNAIEFHDNNFFVSEKRTAEFSELISKENMKWWGEGRIDTIDRYSDITLEKMKDSGCKMIFFGAESGNDAILKSMDKGGTQTGEQILRFAGRMKKHGIIPEYSFVLGTPAESRNEVWKQIRLDVEFIRKVKDINPETEIIIYIYSPVPTEGSKLYNAAINSGFKFPETLDDWISDKWLNFDLRKNPLTPWLEPDMIDYIRNFETVLNGFYPTVSDIRLGPNRRKALKMISAFRYKYKLYSLPFEIKSLQKFWKYRQPEIEGF